MGISAFMTGQHQWAKSQRSMAAQQPIVHNTLGHQGKTMVDRIAFIGSRDAFSNRGPSSGQKSTPILPDHPFFAAGTTLSPKRKPTACL
jgi:hypothetical protein